MHGKIFVILGGIWAAGGDGICPHHPEHTAGCGYIAGPDGAPCGYRCLVCDPLDSGVADAGRTILSFDPLAREVAQQTIPLLADGVMEQAPVLPKTLAASVYRTVDGPGAAAAAVLEGG